MKERISALMDGELDERSAGELIEALGRDREGLETWRIYHLISDAMRENQPLPGGVPVRPQPQSWRWIALPAAASLAAVSLVGWLAFAPQQEAAPLVTQVPAAAPVVASAPAPAPIAAPRPATVVVPLPSAAGDYLLAHQGYSPRMSFQGMAPYVRSVSDEARGTRRDEARRREPVAGSLRR